MKVLIRLTDDKKNLKIVLLLAPQTLRDLANSAEVGGRASLRKTFDVGDNLGVVSEIVLESATIEAVKTEYVQDVMYHSDKILYVAVL